MPDPKYTWFVRTATNPMAIRRLADNGSLTGRVVINNMDILFHQTSYLKAMPGFLMIPNFDPTKSKNDLKFIKMWPPPSISQEMALDSQTIETTNVIDPQEVVYEEVDKVEEEKIDATTASQIISENSTSDFSINYGAFDKYYNRLNDNKYWRAVTKNELTQLLTEANVNFDGIEERWDLIKLVKRIMREHKTQE